MATKNKKETVKKAQVEKIPEYYKRTTGRLSSITPIVCKERSVQLVIGGLGTGKTTQTKKTIKKYIKKFPDEKVLIVDFNNEYSEYKKYDNKGFDKIKKPCTISTLSINALNELIRNFRNGLLVIEGGIITDINTVHLLVALTSVNRSKDIDVIFHFNSIKQVPYKILVNTSGIRIHNHNSANIQRDANIGESLWVGLDIKNSPMPRNDFSFIYVDMLNNKIKGASELELYYSCMNFLSPQISELANKLK
jgi:hypothetical protein